MFILMSLKKDKLKKKPKTQDSRNMCTYLNQTKLDSLEVKLYIFYIHRVHAYEHPSRSQKLCFSLYNLQPK